MISKDKEKLKAIKLRKLGFTYSEILSKIPVAKSSLSLWLKSVGLSKAQKQRITDKKLASALRGAMRKKMDRIAKTKQIKEIAEREVGNLTKREKWLIGVALYWAEGSKEKEWRPGSRAQFINSDPLMINFFIKWLYACKISKNMLVFDIYLHDNNKHRLDEIIEFWSNQTDFPKDSFQHIYYKKNKIKTKRKNIGNTYFGIIKINVKESSGFNRRIAGWTNGILKSII